jgi:uncharacterized protein YjbI with pentapeptide repeats
MAELATEYISVSDVEAGTLAEICALVRGILLQDDDIILKAKHIDLNLFVGYMRAVPEGFILSEFKGGEAVQGGLFIANAEIVNLNDVIDLDQYKADVITFHGCRFSDIKGIKGETKSVNFEKCNFDNIFIPADDAKESILIHVSKCNISECVFNRCSVPMNLIKIEEGNIENCRFIDCKGVNIANTFLLDIREGNIRSSVFERCEAEVLKMVVSFGRLLTGGVVSLRGGRIANCKFLSCSVLGKAFFNKSYLYVVKLVSASIEDSEFAKCSLFSDSSHSNAEINDYILGLKGASDKNVSFNACKSEYTETEYTRNMGVFWEPSSGKKITKSRSSFNKGEIT